jgi:hypothetical protein
MSQIHIANKLEWANKIDLWRQSGKSARSWCKENNIVYTTFIGWCKRLQPKQNDDKPKISSKVPFIELKDEPKTCSGISLEYDGILIHLKAEFNTSLLKRCLAVVRGMPC